MSKEKTWEEVPPKNFLANGGADGLIQVPSAIDFHVKQQVLFKANSLPNLALEIKYIKSQTEMYVGPKGKIELRTDMSDYVLGLNPTVEAAEQNRPAIPDKEYERACFEEEPVVAKRVVIVDRLGNKIDKENPLQVQLSDGSVNIGTVNAELEVQLSHRDNFPDPGDVHDSTRIGDGENEVTATKAAEGDRVGLNTTDLGSFFTKPFTKLTVLTRNADGDPLTIRSRYGVTDVQLLTIEYDDDGNFDDGEVTDY